MEMQLIEEISDGVATRANSSSTKGSMRTTRCILKPLRGSAWKRKEGPIISRRDRRRQLGQASAIPHNCVPSH
jgi:hypothetical protein